MRASLLALVDLGALVGAFAIAIHFWAVGVRKQPVEIYLGLAPLLLLFTLGFAKARLYPGFGLGAVETLRRLVLWTTFVFLLLAATSFAAKAPPLYSRVTFALALLLSLPLLPICRLLFLRLIRRVSWWAEPALVVGSDALARRTIQTLDHALSLGYRPSWVLTTGESQQESVADLPVVGELEDAGKLAERGVRVVLVACEGFDEGSELVEELQRDFRHVILVRPTRGTQIEGVVLRNMGGVLGLELPNQLLQRRNRLLKRGLDLCIAVPVLLLSLPVIALAALAIKIVSPGPAFFYQQREGLKGRPFKVGKLRTMSVDAERRLEEHLANDTAARHEWRSGYKLSRDPRIIPVIGGFLRRFSIDELPQLWSVLVGHMSLVGPRPFPEYHLRRFSPRFRRLRRRVRPGVSGLWQVMVRSSGGIEDQEFFDGYYIRNWSVWMDLYVLGRTVLAVLAGRGAH